jgi:uncharacterized membrane protein
MEWYLLLGISNGARTMTAIAVLCWFSWLGLLPEPGWASWSGKLISVVIFTIFAVGEWYGDTRPNIGDRTSPPQLLARLAFGGLVGALAAQSMNEPLVGGVLFCWVGVLIGAFGGIRVRLWLARTFGRDVPAGLTESAVAVAIAVLGAWMLHRSNLPPTDVPLMP